MPTLAPPPQQARPLLATASLLALSAALTVESSAQTYLTQPTGAHPYSLVRAVASTPDASWLFVGEGGTVAIQDARATTYAGAAGGPSLPPAKVVQVGRPGVVSAALLPHPELDFDVDTDGDGIAENDVVDVLFVAGGQLGLWMLAVDPRPGAPNRAMRIDDQGNPLNPISEQNSRRFCNQLALVDVGDTTYLAATFGKKDQSHLRLYSLAAVTARFATAAAEVGFELQPAGFTMIGGRTGANMTAITSARTQSSSYVLGMTVDQLTQRPSATAHVYLAMNTHGLMRVSLTPGAGGVAFTKTWGPMFGTGTAYATPVPSGTVNAVGGYPAQWYENLHLYDVTRSPTFDELQLDDPPAFVDVALASIGSQRHLYCAVDHLNWCRFDLGQPWSTSTPVDWHAGEPVPVRDRANWNGQFIGAGTGPQLSAWGGRVHLRPADLPNLPNIPLDQDYAYARALELCEPPPGSTATGPILVVSYGLGPWAMISDIRSPRPIYDHTFARVSSVPLASLHHVTSSFAYTVVYDATNLAAGARGFIQVGGGELRLPPDQSRSGGPDKIMFLHDDVGEFQTGGPSAKHAACLSYIDLNAPPVGGANTHYWIRDVSQRVGRYCFFASYCEEEPTVLALAHNDAGLRHDGALKTELVQGDWQFVRPNYLPIPGQAFDDRTLEVGLAPRPISQSVSGNESWFFGMVADSNGAASSTGVMRAIVDDPGVGLVSVSEAKWWLTGLNDRWDRNGRAGNYLGGGTHADDLTAFAMATQTQTSTTTNSLAWFNVPGMPDCLFVGDRDELMMRVTLLQPNGGTSSPAIDWAPLTRRTRLNCHPEYDHMPYQPGPGYLDAKAWWSEFNPVMADAGASNAWSPRVIHYPDRGPSAPEKWLLAVPCGYLGVPPDLASHNLHDDAAINTAYATWEAGASSTVQALHANYEHGLVQFWDVTSPDDFIFGGNFAPNEPEGSTPLPRIVLPDAWSMAWELDAVTLYAGEAAVVVLFVADFCGHVHAYDITGLPENAPAVLLDTWVCPERFRDDVKTWPYPGPSAGRKLSNVRGLAVDTPYSPEGVVLYAAATEYGIAGLTFRNLGTPAAPNWGFDTAQERWVETPGSPFSVQIRPAVAGGPKCLLVSDGWSGLRIYEPEQ